METVWHGEKVLVTGGAGFIGSHLAEGLSRRGAQVQVLDNFSTGLPRNLLGWGDEAEVLRGDVRSPDDVDRAVRGCTYVFHQAAVASVHRSVEDPVGTSEVNYGGTLNVLVAAARHRVRRVVVASSSSVYGDPTTSRCAETLPLSTLSPYAAHKAAGELLAKAFSHSCGLEVVCLRYFNIYGPRQDPHSAYAGVIPLFVDRLKAGQPVYLFGDGLQTRDFTFVSDVVRANLAAATVEGIAGGTFNVGTGHPTSIGELAQLLAQLLERPLQVESRPPRPGDVRHSCADILHTHHMLGFRANVALRDGLRETLEWYLGQT